VQKSRLAHTHDLCRVSFSIKFVTLHANSEVDSATTTLEFFRLPPIAGSILLDSLCKIDHLFLASSRHSLVMTTAAEFPDWPETDEDIKEQFRRAFGREITGQERNALQIFSEGSKAASPPKKLANAN